jgi:hypothetical protein
VLHVLVLLLVHGLDEALKVDNLSLVLGSLLGNTGHLSLLVLNLGSALLLLSSGLRKHAHLEIP